MAKPLYEVVGKRIADARKRRSISQTELARLSGVTRGSIANIELGNQHPPLDRLWRIASALGVEPRVLVPLRADLRPSEPTDDEVLGLSGKAAKMAGAGTREFVKNVKREEVHGDERGEGSREVPARRGADQGTRRRGARG